MTVRRFCHALLAVLAVAGAPGAAGAQSRNEELQLCVRYSQEWAKLVQQQGRAGLSDVFLRRHAEFLSRGCVSRRDVCPRSPQEQQIAGRITAMAREGDMPPRMLPFGC